MPQKLCFSFMCMKSVFSLVISTLNVIQRIVNDLNKTRANILLRNILQRTKILHIHPEKK